MFDVIKTLLSVRGAEWQDFEGLLWGQGTYDPAHALLGPKARAEEGIC